MTFSADYEWQSAYLPHVKRLIGEALIREGSFEEDAEQATDLIVLRLDGFRVGVRIRRPEYFERYQDEFTIRSRRDTGSETELAKIRAGWGDYLFYAFASTTPARLRAARLLDLTQFRFWLNDCPEWPQGCHEQANGDGTYFLACKVFDAPQSLIVAEWGHRQLPR